MSIEKNQPAEEPLEIAPKDAEGQTSELSAEEADKVAGAFHPPEL
jgi:hypothetical protein